MLQPISHFVRSPYNYNRDLASDDAGLSCPEETKAQQHFKDECDINEIVRRFGVTGQLPVTLAQPLQDEFVEVTDYQSALNALIAADDAFMALPAVVRKRFDNDPAAYVDFMSDPKNKDEAIKLGIIPTPPAQPPEPSLEHLDGLAKAILRQGQAASKDASEGAKA